MKKFPYILSALLLILMSSSCNEDIDIPAMDPDEGRLITVPVSIGSTEYEYDLTTKGNKPETPDVENLIFDIWVVQYSSRGVILPEATYHYRTNETTGDLTVSDLYIAGSTEGGIKLVQSTEPCTVCFLVNMGDNVPEWPDNLLEYQDIMMPVLSSDAAEKLTRTPMCGFYHGPVTHGNQVTVSLGRMITRLNVVINNETGYDLTNLVVSITNAPRYAHIFPNINITPLNTLENEATRPQRDEGKTVPAGGSLNLYYYMAPNLYGAAWPTTLWTTCTMNGASMQGAMILGDTMQDANEQNTYPPVAGDGRDLRLYPNNLYTFTINYVDQK